MSLQLKFYLFGAQIHQIPETNQVPRKGDHLLWNGLLLEVAMVVWTGHGAVHLYLARELLRNPLPPGLEDACGTLPPP